MAAITPKPSSFGICTSRKTRSGWSRRMAETAARPFEHSPITSISGSLVNRMRMPSRASGSSSTINVRIFSIYLSGGPGRMKWKAGSHYQTTIIGITPFEASFAPIKMIESRAGVGEPDTFNKLSLARANPRTVVPHFKRNMAVPLLGADFYQSTRLAVGDAMAEGILDQRLKDEPRNHAIQCRRINEHPNRQSIPEAGLFDLQITLKKFQLLS